MCDQTTLLSTVSSAKKTTKLTTNFLAISLLTIVVVLPVVAEVPEKARLTIDRIIGSRGTYISDDQVYKVALPLEAATIVLKYQTLSPNVGLNSWAAFMSAIHHEALLTGQLLLLEDEVDPVMTAVLNAGLDVTGLSESSIFDGPRLKTLDIAGTGTYEELAAGFRKALDEARHTRAAAGGRVKNISRPQLLLDGSIDPDPLNALLSMRGSVSHGVYHAAIGRHALLRGETIGREMGISTWVSFAGTNDHAVAQGEFAATLDDLQVLLKALRSRYVSITAIRNHTTGEHPQYLFVRFWQEGKAADLARNLRYALDVQLGTGAKQRSGNHAE